MIKANKHGWKIPHESLEWEINLNGDLSPISRQCKNSKTRLDGGRKSMQLPLAISRKVAS